MEAGNNDNGVGRRGYAAATPVLLAATYNNIGALLHYRGDRAQSTMYLEQAVEVMEEHVTLITPTARRRWQEDVALPDVEFQEAEIRLQRRMTEDFRRATDLERSLVPQQLPARGNNTQELHAEQEARSYQEARNHITDNNNSSTQVCTPIFINKAMMRASRDIYRNSATILFNMAVNRIHALGEGYMYGNITNEETQRLFNRSRLLLQLALEALDANREAERSSGAGQRVALPQVPPGRPQNLDEQSQQQSALAQFHSFRDTILSALIMYHMGLLQRLRNGS